MALVLKLNGFDLTPYLRVNQGDGLAMADPDVLEPHWGDSAVSRGRPLINISERNRELVIPVFLNPAKSGGAYPTSRDGLHDLVTAVHRACAAADQVEWREDGATRTAYFDVEFSRFEVDYDYRRAAALWVGGRLRITCRPHAHTGTYRIVGTAQASQTSGLAQTAGARMFLPVGSIAGDAVPDARWHMLVPSVARTYEGMAFVTAVVPADHTVEWPARTLTPNPGIGTLVANAQSLGSQSVRAIPTSTHWLLSMSLTPATPYVRRHHLLAMMANAGVATAGIYAAVNSPAGVLATGPVAAVPAASSGDFRMYDLGALSAGTIVLAAGQLKYMLHAASAAAMGSAVLHVADLFVLPSEQTAVCYIDRWLATNSINNASAVLGSPGVADVTPRNVTAPLKEDASTKMHGTIPAPTAPAAVYCAAIPHRGGLSLHQPSYTVAVRERFSYHR